jgi:hypothetical protein
MNYRKHYQTLIDRAPKNRPNGVYLERHRIVPGCMGGEYVEENIVYLTPEEHYVAHQLLVKMYPNQSKLWYAANTLGNTNNKIYGWIKRKHSGLMKGNKFGAKNKGRKLSEGQKEKLRKPKTEAHKEALRKPKANTENIKMAARRRSPPSEEQKRKTSETMKRIRAERYWRSGRHKMTLNS